MQDNLCFLHTKEFLQIGGWCNSCYATFSGSGQQHRPLKMTWCVEFFHEKELMCKSLLMGQISQSLQGEFLRLTSPNFSAKSGLFWCSFLQASIRTARTTHARTTLGRHGQLCVLDGRRGAFLCRVLVPWTSGRLPAMATRQLSYPTPQFARNFSQIFLSTVWFLWL